MLGRTLFSRLPVLVAKAWLFHGMRSGRVPWRGVAQQGSAQLEVALPVLERTWAVEGANGIGRPLGQRLLAEGERVLDVPANTISSGSVRSSRSPLSRNATMTMACASAASVSRTWPVSKTRVWAVSFEPSRQRIADIPADELQVKVMKYVAAAQHVGRQREDQKQRYFRGVRDRQARYYACRGELQREHVPLHTRPPVHLSAQCGVLSQHDLAPGLRLGVGSQKRTARLPGRAARLGTIAQLCR